MEEDKVVRERTCGKKARGLAGAVLMAISMAGMASFYYKEEKVSAGYQEIAEAVVSASALSKDFEQGPDKDAKETYRFSDGEGKKEKELLRLAVEENSQDAKAGDNQEWEISYDWEVLASINKDVLGWLYLPGSLIDFPVVGASDNGFYLSHDFTGKASSAGCPFMDKGTGIEDFNRVIYGHNMGTGSEAMFSTLLLFKEEAYFDKNRTLYFTECFGITEAYDVIAVVKYDVKDTGEWDFRIRNHESREDYSRWFEQLAKRAIYYREPGKPPDRILTLSTCDRSEFGRDGRLLIVAVAEGGGSE